MHSNIFKLLQLQFFADGAAAGDGGDGGAAAGAAATGVETVNPGQTRTLEDLGVPKAKAERHRARMAKRGISETAQQSASAEPNEQAAAATAKMTLEDVLKDPEENEKLQRMFKDRLKKPGEELDKRRKLDGALSLVAKKYGLGEFDINTFDADAFIAAVEGDESYFEKEALEKGESTKKVMEDHKQQKQEAEKAKLQLAAHYKTMMAQSEEMKALYPDFDLDKELDDPTFFNLTSPKVGLSVKQAYQAIHFDDIVGRRVNETVHQTKQAVVNSIRSGQKLPNENGTEIRSSGPITQKLYKDMTPEERKEFYRRQTGRDMPKYRR